MNNQKLYYWQLIIRCVSIVEERRNLRICLVCFYLFSSFLSFFCFFLFYQCLNFRVFLLLSKINWSQFFVSFPSWRLPRNIIVESLSFVLDCFLRINKSKDKTKNGVNLFFKEKNNINFITGHLWVAKKPYFHTEAICNMFFS